MSERKSQIELLEYLEKIDKTTETISINEPMSGEIDLSVFKKENGFSKIKKIEFSPGNILTIRNIPREIEILTIDQQNISALPPLTDTLLELNVNQNNLSYIDLKDATHLKILRCKNNKISIIENLPRSLEELNIENNQLKQLDLNKMTNLRRLYCSNNPLLMITNQPDTIADFQCNNSPLVNLNENREHQQGGAIDSKTKIEQQLNYIDSLGEYLKIKSQYEKDKKSKISALIKTNIKNGMSRKHAIHNAIKKFKPKCIYCGRPVTTIFSRENSSFTAICGDRINPCQLNIDLYRGSIDNIEYLLNILKEDINEIKETIIRQKMDTLFSYVNENQSANSFKATMEKYTENSDMYADYLNKYNTIFHSEITNDIIEHKKGKINQFIGTIKLRLQDYSRTENSVILQSAMDIYIKDLLPEINGLRQAKYEIMEMDNCQLIQKDRDLRKIELYFQEPSVKNFIVKK